MQIHVVQHIYNGIPSDPFVTFNEEEALEEFESKAVTECGFRKRYEGESMSEYLDAYGDHENENEIVRWWAQEFKSTAVSDKAKHTGGVWFMSGQDIISMPAQIKICKLDPISMSDMEKGGVQMKSNGMLISEAGTVAHETGYTPRHLAEHRSDLLNISNKIEGMLNKVSLAEDAENQDRIKSADKLWAEIRQYKSEVREVIKKVNADSRR
jgi:hypothetical protein